MNGRRVDIAGLEQMNGPRVYLSHLLLHERFRTIPITIHGIFNSLSSPARKILFRTFQIVAWIEIVIVKIEDYFKCVRVSLFYFSRFHFERGILCTAMIATRSFLKVEICIDSLTAFHRYSDLSKDFYASKRVTWINFDTDTERNKEREMLKKKFFISSTILISVLIIKISAFSIRINKHYCYLLYVKSQLD